MENTSNEATSQRPEGDRVLNASLVEMDLNKFIAQIKRETTWANNDRNSITIFKGHSMRIVLIGLNKDAVLKPHTANGIISVQVIEGKIAFTAENQTVSLEKGQMVALQERVSHGLVAVEESFFLLTLALNS